MRPYLARELHEMYGVKTEAEIRALTRRAENPLPCVANGSKRQIRRIYEPVFVGYLLFEQGVATYAEVEQAARRCVIGAWS